MRLPRVQHAIPYGILGHTVYFPDERGQDMKLAIGNDHTAIAYKKALLEYLQERGVDATDFGTDEGERAEYPIYAERVANVVAAGEYELGILICGTGAGMCLAANKVNGIRAVMCSEPYTAKLSREHNAANILCMGARVIGLELAKMITSAWLDAVFLGGRHQERVEMIMDIERRN
jgi:ribose 5-phosphate isomerase B